MKKLYRKVWLFLFLFARDSNKEGARLCLRKKTVLRTVFADAVKEHRDAKAYGSMPKKSLAELTIVFYNTKTGRQFGCLLVLLFLSNIGGVENHLGFEKVVGVEISSLPFCTLQSSFAIERPRPLPS